MKERKKHMEKITYIDALSNAIALLEIHAKDGSDEDFDVAKTIEKLTALRDKTIMRNSHKSSKPTKKQEENTEVKARIRENMTDCDPMACGEIANMVGISIQKCSALLSQMVKAGEVVKTEEKRVSYFSLADEDDDVQALPSEISM
jgi:predicted Rossmann fold nucleotide-binding protein DprA/Smf involved in DNA uptake